MFKTRLISGIVLVILAILLIGTGGEVLLVSMGVVSIIGLYEFYRVFDIHKKMLGVVGYLAVIFYYLNLEVRFLEYDFLFVIASMMLILAVYVLRFPKYHANQMVASFFGIIYVGVLVSCVYQTRMLPMGNYIVWLIFLSSWGCDTCAYCAGMLFGKHKMAPVLSPKKTIEGAVGGVIGSVLLTLLYGIAIRSFAEVTNELLIGMIITALCGSVISMLGDLAASAIKRDFEVKDYGKLIPGHGGILDRFDSVFFTAPIVFYLSLYLL